MTRGPRVDRLSGKFTGDPRPAGRSSLSLNLGPTVGRIYFIMMKPIQVVEIGALAASGSAVPYGIPLSDYGPRWKPIAVQ